MNSKVDYYLEEKGPFYVERKSNAFCITCAFFAPYYPCNPSGRFCLTLESGEIVHLVKKGYCSKKMCDIFTASEGSCENYIKAPDREIIFI